MVEVLELVALMHRRVSGHRGRRSLEELLLLTQVERMLMDAAGRGRHLSVNGRHVRHVAIVVVVVNRPIACAK